MVQPGRPWGWRRRPPAGPGIEADVVMVAAGREEHGIAAVAGRDVEAEHVAIERNGAVEIGHRQMNVANTSGGGESHRGFLPSALRRWGGWGGGGVRLSPRNPPPRDPCPPTRPGSSPPPAQ